MNSLRADFSDPMINDVLFSCELIEGEINAGDKILIDNQTKLIINEVKVGMLKNEYLITVKDIMKSNVKVFELYDREFVVV